VSGAHEALVTAPTVQAPVGTIIAGRRCPGCGVLDVIVTASGRIVCKVCRWGRLVGVIPTTCPDCRQTVVVPAAAFERCGRRPRRRRV